MTEAEMLKIIDNLKILIMRPIYFNGIKLELLEVKRSKHSCGRVITPHYHPWFEFNFFISGSLQTTACGKTFITPEGMSHLMPPGTSHSHINFKDGDDGICIRWQISRQNSFEDENDILIKNMNTPRAECFDADMEILFSLGKSVELNQAVFLSWLLKIYDNEICTDNSLVHRKNHISNQAIIYLSEYYSQNISVRDVANALNISYRNLSRIFKKETGVTIVEKLNEIRINEARRLLIDTDFPISKIAEDVGFLNVYYFSNTFKKYSYVSPAKFRENNL